jgi:flagellar hook-associated protein 2
MAGVNFSGFNGFDFGQIINTIIQSESAPLNAIRAQESAVREKDSALSTLGGLIGKLQTPVNTLNSETVFTNVGATSSDTSVATTSLGSGAIAGRYDLNITALARGQVTASTNGYADTTDVAADSGTLSFTIDGEETEAITITSSTTLAELKDAINNQNSGVIASIVNNGTNNKLVISSRETGASNAFTINNSLVNSGGAVPAFAGNTQTAQDAAFTVNGLNITSSSNTVTAAVPGVTVTLVETGTASISVSADYGALKETVKTLVSEYNKLREFAGKQALNNPTTGMRSPLANDSVLRQALSDIRNTLLASNDNGGQYHYLAEIGVEFSQTGDLKFDETKFNAALDSYPTDLKKLFQGTAGVDGVFDTLKAKLDNVDGTAGLVKTTRNSIDLTLKSYRDRITAQELRLDLRRNELTRLYAAADQAMSRLNAMSGQLSSLGSRAF